MKIYRKYLIIGIVVLLIGASVTTTISSQLKKSEVIKNSSIGRGWSDNFDSYTTGQFLDGGADDGGWKGWDNDPFFGAYVVDTQARSSPHSVEIAGDSDLVHEYSGYTSGQWTYTAWVYVPSDFSGNSYFMLLSDYEDGLGEACKWQLVIRFDSDNQIVESENDANSVALITDEWIELRTEIDLDADWFQFYYDGSLLLEKAWTAGWDNAGDGYLKIDAVDLFAYTSSAIYYDDITLEGEGLIPQICCQGDLRWEDVNAGSTVTGQFEISNCGDDGSELNWEIESYPDFGTWTFTPSSGTGLTTEAGWITIDVQVVAPTEKDEFIGTIKVVNSDDFDDNCEINVYIKTPRARSHSFPIIQNILERIPKGFSILRQLLGM